MTTKLWKNRRHMTNNVTTLYCRGWQVGYLEILMLMACSRLSNSPLNALVNDKRRLLWKTDYTML